MKVHSSNAIVVKQTDISIHLENEEELAAFRYLLEMAEKNVSERTYYIGPYPDPKSKLTREMIDLLREQTKG